MKLAIVVGHTLKSQGAYSPTLAQTERLWNAELAARIKDLAPAEVAVFLRDGHGVAGAYAQAKAWGAEAVVELHFNSAADRQAQGTETLYAQPGSRRLAEALQRHLVAALGLRDRGAKPPWQGRGEASLTALPGVPSVIVEPFFGSNPDDCAVARSRRAQLAAAILAGAREGLAP